MKEGTKGRALHPSLGLVETVYLRKDLPWEDPPGVIPNLLVGVYLEEDLILAIPQESVKEIKKWRAYYYASRGLKDPFEGYNQKVNKSLSDEIKRRKL